MTRATWLVALCLAALAAAGAQARPVSRGETAAAVMAALEASDGAHRSAVEGSDGRTFSPLAGAARFRALSGRLAAGSKRGVGDSARAFAIDDASSAKAAIGAAAEEEEPAYAEGRASVSLTSSAVDEGIAQLKESIREVADEAVEEEKASKQPQAADDMRTPEEVAAAHDKRLAALEKKLTRLQKMLKRMEATRERLRVEMQAAAKRKAALAGGKVPDNLSAKIDQLVQARLKLREKSLAKALAVRLREMVDTMQNRSIRAMKPYVRQQVVAILNERSKDKIDVGSFRLQQGPDESKLWRAKELKFREVRAGSASNGDDEDGSDDDEAAAETASDSTPPADVPLDVHGKPDYSYAVDGPRGPAAWARLADAYATCGSGRSQSPVSLSDSAAAVKDGLPGLQLEYGALSGMPLSVVNDGHVIALDWPRAAPRAGMAWDGHFYRLDRLLLRVPSEHQVNGEPSSMELQLQHHNDDSGKTAMLSLLMDEGMADEGLLSDLFTQLPTFEANTPHSAPVVSHLVDAKLALGDNLFGNASTSLHSDAFFVYSGSLSAPPCTEGVSWFVLKTPLLVPAGHVDALRDALPERHNARPMQDAHWPEGKPTVYTGGLQG